MYKRPTSLPPLAEIARETGEAILSMQADIVARRDWVRKEDGSPVTPADYRAHDIITARLAEKLPGVAVVSEEGTDEERQKALVARDRIECDPIDNTEGYIHGRTGFSVNLGRIKDGVPVEGAVYFPARRELYYTRDGKAYLQKDDATPEEISVKGLPVRRPLRIAVGYNVQNLDFLGERELAVCKHPGQYRTCKVAMGECDVTGLNGGGDVVYKSWDVAGPHAVLLAAGGDCVTEEGKPMRYDSSSAMPPYIAGGVDTLKAIGLADPEYFKSARIVNG